MKRLAIASLFALSGAFISPAYAQTPGGSVCPYIAFGARLTPSQWNYCFQIKQDFIGYVPVNKAGDTMQGELITQAPSTAGSGFNIQPGAAPAAPNNGDLWTTSSGMFVRIGGATIQLTGAGSGSFTASNPLAASFPSAGVVNYALNYNSTLTLDGSNNLELNLAHANTFTATQTFPNNSLTLAEFPTFGADTVLGSIAGGTPATLSQAQLTSLINPFTTSLSGAVPAPGSTTGRFLRDDGTWEVTPGSGTVTEQKNTASGGLATSGNCDNTTTNASSPCNYALTAARQTLPTTQVFLSGSGTYTTPAGVLWDEVELRGGGGGGSSIGSGSGAGTAGGDSCWNASGPACTTPVYDAGGGGAGSAGSPGGAVSGTGTCTRAIAGAGGGINGGGDGGGQTLFNNGSQTGGNGVANSGGGGGPGNTGTSANSGGGEGAWCDVIINNPAASYTYTVGAAGTGNTGGAAHGGNGGSGGIWVIEHYGS